MYSCFTMFVLDDTYLLNVFYLLLLGAWCNT